MALFSRFGVDRVDEITVGDGDREWMDRFDVAVAVCDSRVVLFGQTDTAASSGSWYVREHPEPEIPLPVMEHVIDEYCEIRPGLLFLRDSSAPANNPIPLGVPKE